SRNEQIAAASSGVMGMYRSGCGEDGRLGGKNDLGSYLVVRAGDGFGDWAKIVPKFDSLINGASMNKKDKRGIVVRNKARLVAQGHTQEEGIDYEEVFAPVARIEAIRLFLAYASFMGFMVYQMDVNSAFLYGTIEEEGLRTLIILTKSTKWSRHFMVYIKLLVLEKPLLKDPDGEDVDVHTYRSMIGSLMYLTSSRPDIMFAVNDVTRLQALVDKKKVVITEAAIREVLRLDDAQELARMGYEKPSTKLTFYKAFFSSQWKFLIYNILQCMSAKRTSWNEFSSSMASAVICLSTGRKFNFSKYIFNSLVRNVDSTTKFYMYLHFLQLIIRRQVGNLSTHTTKYASPALTHKVFANTKRVEKGFFGVETPLFEGMLVEQEIEEEGDADEHVEEVNTGVLLMKKFLLLLKNHLYHLLHHLLYHHNHLKISLQHLRYNKQHHNHLRRVEHLEYDKVAQALEITKLKKRVKKREKRNKVKVLKLRRLQRVGTSQRVDTFDDTVMDDESFLSMQEDETESAEVQEVVDVVTTIKLITEVVTAASETVTPASVIIPTAEPQVPAAILTTALARVAAAPSRRRKGVVIKDPEEESTTSTIIPAETKSKDKGKGILVEEPKPLKKKQQIEGSCCTKISSAKEKPQTKAQARKNIIVYLKNVAGFKMDYFKGMSYDDIRPIFEADSRIDSRI
nr:copia protein [Tanacetum cinerariifolium]